VTVSVTSNGSAVENASVAVNGTAVGDTDANGTVAFDLGTRSAIELAVTLNGTTQTTIYAVEDGTLVAQTDETEDAEAVPEAAPEQVSTIQRLIGAFRNGEFDKLGPVISDAVSNDGNADRADNTSGQPDDAGPPEEVGNAPDEAGPPEDAGSAPDDTGSGPDDAGPPEDAGNTDSGQDAAGSSDRSDGAAADASGDSDAENSDAGSSGSDDESSGDNGNSGASSNGGSGNSDGTDYGDGGNSDGSGDGGGGNSDGGGSSNAGGGNGNGGSNSGNGNGPP